MNYLPTTQGTRVLEKHDCGDQSSGNDNKMVRNPRNVTFDLTILMYCFPNTGRVQLLENIPTSSQANFLSYTKLAIFKCFLIAMLRDKSSLGLTSDPAA